MAAFGLVLALKGEARSSCTHANKHTVTEEHNIPVKKQYTTATYTLLHGQRLSLVKVGEDQSDCCQSFAL